ncbi:hypothetical protein [Glycomyces harbinensis]|uniref:Uncharacterized protein n=1 Tax=Glycomyces harbinensis TaxID=58114 RepID=A0A1G7CDB0_9ACTN|nr:hypothetical protein [Glycomyces harbinensis]SDE37352.1 hypothetical protein SAMN05216270_11997 [Glycomyces harbinensis]
MDEERWNEIIESGRQGDSGPWLCYDCDDPNIEMGVRFEDKRVVELTFMCNACATSVTVPA